MTFSLQSEAFTHNGEIPKKYTCEGQDASPPLHWQAIPDGTKSLVLIVDDPDAPDPRAPKMTWVHWVLYNLPPEANRLSEAVGNAAGSAQLPARTKEGSNDWGRTGYGGPCPPIGRHRYFHKLYALDIVLEDMDEPDKDALETAMEGHVIAKAELMGTYLKGD
ncbi:MAG: YbhB/YbcL family Raf kinase inhibitor-like protein [Gammaproteobacteria bacterium]|nr:YbhB/YbcL family Raf kinase inhibitor-like protein [Gammaproteobacteria bacterium]